MIVQNQKGKGDGVIIEDIVNPNKPQKSKQKNTIKNTALSKMSKNPIYHGVKTNAGGLQIIMETDDDIGKERDIVVRTENTTASSAQSKKVA